MHQREEFYNTILRIRNNDPTVRYVYITAMWLNTEDALQLAKAMNGNDKVESLNLSGNKINTKGINAIFKSLEDNRSVIRLDIRYNSFDPGIVKPLQRLLEKNKYLIQVSVVGLQKFNIQAYVISIPKNRSLISCDVENGYTVTRNQKYSSNLAAMLSEEPIPYQQTLDAKKKSYEYPISFEDFIHLRNGAATPLKHRLLEFHHKTGHEISVIFKNLKLLFQYKFIKDVILGDITDEALKRKMYLVFTNTALFSVPMGDDSGRSILINFALEDYVKLKKDEQVLSK